MIIKSPIFYMGNKYDLMKNLLMYFPKQEDVNLFIDLFGGSGVVSANAPYKNVVYNELNHNIVELFKLFVKYSSDEINKAIQKNIEIFDLPKNMIQKSEGIKAKEKNYYNFRKYYNQSNKDYLDLLTLSYFSFSNLIRFNSKSEFNMPYGLRCYIKGEHDIQIKLFNDILKQKDIKITNEDAIEYLKKIKSNVGQFIYLDPPYLNTMAIYNENRAFGGWNMKHDLMMMSELDRLNDLGIKWAMSNVLENKGKRNLHLEIWANQHGYTIIDFENKQYASLGKGNAKTQEVLIINYKPPFERFNIFDFLD